MTKKTAVALTTSEKRAKKAKRLFFVGLLDISWRLAAAIIVPVILGAWLDNRLGGGDFFVLAGVLLGAIFAGVVIYQQVKKLNREIRDV